MAKKAAERLITDYEELNDSEARQILLLRGYGRIGLHVPRERLLQLIRVDELPQESDLSRSREYLGFLQDYFAQYTPLVRSQMDCDLNCGGCSAPDIRVIECLRRLGMSLP